MDDKSSLDHFRPIITSVSNLRVTRDKKRVYIVQSEHLPSKDRSLGMCRITVDDLSCSNIVGNKRAFFTR